MLLILLDEGSLEARLLQFSLGLRGFGGVLHGADQGGGPAGVPTDGFRFLVQSYAPAPAGGAPGMTVGCDQPFVYRWPTWEVPTWYPERKPVIDSLGATFRSLGPTARPAPARQR